MTAQRDLAGEGSKTSRQFADLRAQSYAQRVMIYVYDEGFSIKFFKLIRKIIFDPFRPSTTSDCSSFVSITVSHLAFNGPIQLDSTSTFKKIKSITFLDSLKNP
jgi:hypothetical protein